MHGVSTNIQCHLLMDLLNSFTDFIKKEKLFQHAGRLILAVSGGVDSVALCELCKEAGYDFVIAHCNFQLRGEESERDEQFVKDLGKKYNVEVLIKKFDTAKASEEQKRGIQEVARGLRYAWFLELWSQQASDTSKRCYVVTAHHANDNIETLLMNFFKGTGINGLHGILPKQGIANYLVRPLLFAKKEELLSFAKENNFSFVEDSSNESDKYTRNFFRNQLIPSIQKVFPQVEDNLADNLQRFKEIQLLYDQSIATHKKKLLEYKGEEVHIPVLKLLKAEPLPTLIYEIISDFGFSPGQVTDVISLLNSDSGKYVSSSSHRILKNRNWLIISPIDTSIALNILIEKDQNKISYPGGEVNLEMLEGNVKLSTEVSVAMVDAGLVKFPLLLRKWKTGDYFYPLGMNKKKKLSRFFIDLKMSLLEKENTWVIESGKKIVWVIGKRIDDRFKLTPHTKSILKISQY